MALLLCGIVVVLVVALLRLRGFVTLLLCGIVVVLVVAAVIEVMFM